MATQTSPPTTVRGRGWRRIVLVVLLAMIVVGLYPLGRYIWASTHYREAANAINRKDFNEALRHLEICCREWPDSAEAHFLAARTARRAGDLETAKSYLKDSLRLNWVRDSIELEQALIGLQQQMISGIQQNEYPRLRTMLMNKVREGHPDSLLILVVLTPIAEQVADGRLAAECVDRWIAFDPSDPRPHILMGNVWSRMQNNSGASKMYREAVQLDPNNVEARLKLAKSLMLEKFFDKAKEQFDWLMQRDPKDPDARFGLAQVEQGNGNNDGARQILDDLVKDRPDDPEILGLLGQLQFQADETQAAEKTLRKAYAIAPYDLHVMYQLYQTLERLDQHKEAEELRAKWQKGTDDDHEIAIKLRGLNKDEHDPEARRQIAIRLISRGLPERGYQWLLSGLADDPSHIPTHETLVDYYEKHGDPKKAEEHRQIIKLLQQQKKAEQTTRPAPTK